jgi:hypothetical protein
MKTFLFIISLLVCQYSVGQQYAGMLADKNTLLLKINNDSSITMVVNSLNNEAYMEFHGQLYRINDTSFRAKALLTLAQKSKDDGGKIDEYFTVRIDTSLSKENFNSIRIHYFNYHRDTAFINLSDSVIALKYDKRYFGSSSKLIDVMLDRMHPFFTKKKLVFRFRYGQSANFYSGSQIELNFVKHGNRLLLVKDNVFQEAAMTLRMYSR